MSPSIAPASMPASVGYSTLSSFRGASVTPLCPCALTQTPGHRCLISPRTHDQCNQSDPPGLLLCREETLPPPPTWKGWQCCSHLITRGVSVSEEPTQKQESQELEKHQRSPGHSVRPEASGLRFLEPTAFLVGLTYVRFSVICKKNPSFRTLFY